MAGASLPHSSKVSITPYLFVGRHLPHMQAQWVGVAHCLPGHVQCHHKVRTSDRDAGNCLYHWSPSFLPSLPPPSFFTRMVESELLPALRYFGLRFYAYNPVSVQPNHTQFPVLGTLLKQQTIASVHVCGLSPVSFPVLQFLVARIR